MAFTYYLPSRDVVCNTCTHRAHVERKEYLLIPEQQLFLGCSRCGTHHFTYKALAPTKVTLGAPDMLIRIEDDY